MNNQPELESFIRERLDEIKSVPARNPQLAARGRARFLAQAISASELQRHKGWKSIFRKEEFAMNMIISVLVIAGLLFGTGATVNAAQDDLPNEPLYAVKVWSEELSLRFQNDPEQKADRLMELAQLRIQEMTRVTDAGQAVPDPVRRRLEGHIQQALQLCSNMEDTTLDRALLQIRDRLQQQDRDMQQLLIHAAQDAQPALAQTRTMLQQRLQLVEAGLLNHEAFRYAIRNGLRYAQEEEATPPAQNRNTEQNRQPSSVPGEPDMDPRGPNTVPGGPNTQPDVSNPEPIGPNLDPGGPNTQPGGSNPEPTGPNLDSGGQNTEPGGPNPGTTPMPKQDGSGPNHEDSGGNQSGGENSGGSGPGGMDSGGNGAGGEDPGGNGPGGKRP